MSADAPTASPQALRRYDRAKMRRGLRSQGQRGVMVYIPAVELAKAGFDPQGPVPLYRLWATSKGGVMVRLYAE